MSRMSRRGRRIRGCAGEAAHRLQSRLRAVRSRALAEARAQREQISAYARGCLDGASDGYRVGYRDGLADAARALQGQGTVRR